MSSGSVVDERVVRLDFDNEQFERKVGVSSKTVEKLKQSLNFDNTNKKLLALNDAAKKIDFTPISTNIDSVKMEFSALQVAAVTTMSRVTNAVIDTGKNLAYKFNIEPITSGLQEYETQINSVQTILANTQDKGTTLDQVNAALDELNHYADMTIYNFTQMTRNIGTFTAAGVDLETSVNAIQGIANLAAISGSSSQQASVAMYQLSQALATGTVKLQDWNSVVNAGMGGQVFQNALKRTATVMGTNVDALIEKYGSFRESLTQGNWLTTDVLTETLGQFAGAYDEATLLSKGYSKEQTEQILQMAKTATDAATKVKTFTQLMDTLGEAAQSGWTETWELIIGDFDQAKTMWTGVSDVLQKVIGNSANARNKLVSNVMQSNWDKFAAQLDKTGISMDELTDKIRISAAEAGYENLDDLIAKYGTLGSAFEHGALSSDILTNALMKMKGTITSLDGVASGLQFGSTGDDVSKVQSALVKLGYTLEQYGVDGKIGSETTAAIKAFQEAKNIDATGIIDDNTLAALKEASVGIGGVSNNLLLLARNVDELGGRSLLLESFSNLWKSFSQITDSVKAGWKDVFPESTASRAERILNVIKGFHSFTETLNLSATDMKRLQKSFSGMFSIVKLLSDLFNGGLKAGSTFAKAMFGDIDIDVIDIAEHLGNGVQTFTDWIRQTKLATDATTKLAPAIQNGVKNFKEWANELDAVEEAKSFFENVKTSLEEISGMGDSSIGDKIAVIKNRLEELGGNKLAVISKGFLDFGSVTKSTFMEIPGFIDGGIEKLQEFVEYVKSLGGVTKDNIRKVLSKFNETIGEYISKAGDTFTELSDAVGNAKDKISDHVESLLGIGNKIKGIFKAIGDFADDHEIGKKLTNGAIVIGMFTLSFKILQFVTNISSIVKLLLGYAKKFAHVRLAKDKAEVWEQRAKTFRIMAESILMIAGALALVSSIPTDQLIKSGIALGVALAALVAALAGMELINKYIGSGSSKLALTLLSLTGSITLIVVALKAMESLDPTKVNDNVAVLAKLVAGLLIVAFVMSEFKSSGSNKFDPTLAVNMLVFATSMIIIVKALKELNSLSGDMNQLIISCTLLAGLMIILGLVTTLMGKMSFSGGMGVLTTVVSIKILINILRDIVDMDLSGLKGKMGELTTIFGLLILLMASTRLAGKHGAAGGIGVLAMATSIYMLIGAIKLLGGIDSGTLNKGVQAVTQLMLIMGIITALSGLAGKNTIRAGAQLLLLAVTISALALVIGYLSSIDSAGLNRALHVVTRLVAVFGALMVIMNLTTISKNIKMGPILSMTMLIGVMVGSLALLAHLDADKLSGAADALISVSTVFAALARAIGFMNKLSPNLKTTVVSLVAITAILVAVAGVVALIAKFANVETYISIAFALANLMKALSVFTVATALLGVGAGGFAALLKVLPMITVIGLICIGINELMSLIDAGAGEWVFDKLKSFFTGIGELVGSIVNGIVNVFTPDVEGIGKGLSTMVESLKPFCENVKSIDDSTVSGVKNLVEAMMAITAESLFDRIASIGDDQTSIERFANNLSAFADALIDFNDTVSGTTFNADKINQATKAGTEIADMANSIPTTGGVLQCFMGEHDFGKFSNNLTGFAKGINAFATITSHGNFDSNTTTLATEAGKKIADMAQSIPNSGGALQWLTGEHDLGKFADNLKGFGEGIVGFVNALKGGSFNSDNVTSAMSVISRLANVNETITDSNEYSLDGFTSTLGSVSKALTDFVADIQTIDVGNAETNIANILQLFKSLSDGFTSNRTDVETITALMNNLTQSIKDALAEFSGDQSITTSAQGVLTTFAAGITANEDIITDALYNAITSAIGKASVNATNDTNVQTSANKLAQNLANAMQQESTSGLATAGGDQASAALSGITDKAGDFATAGDTLMSSLNKGLSQKQTVIRNTMVSAVRMALAGVRSYENASYNSGYNFGAGYYNGVGRWITPIANRAAEMVRNAIRAANHAQQSASPAKKLVKVGRWFAQGYANGIKADSNLAAQASSSMVDTAIGTVQGSLATLGSMLSMDLENIQPQISPVVDMSNVTRSAGMINDMLSFDDSLSVMTDLRAISGTINRSRQNGGNSDIIGELRKLRSVMENIPAGNTTNINGVTYDDGSAVGDAVGTLIRAIVMEGRM